MFFLLSNLSHIKLVNTRQDRQRNCCELQRYRRSIFLDSLSFYSPLFSPTSWGSRWDCHSNSKSESNAISSSRVWRTETSFDFISSSLFRFFRHEVFSVVFLSPFHAWALTILCHRSCKTSKSRHLFLLVWCIQVKQKESEEKWCHRKTWGLPFCLSRQLVLDLSSGDCQEKKDSMRWKKDRVQENETWSLESVLWILMQCLDRHDTQIACRFDIISLPMFTLLTLCLLFVRWRMSVSSKSA